MLRAGVKKKKENVSRGGVRNGKKKRKQRSVGDRFEQCVGDFCSVPRGDVKKKRRKEKREPIAKCTKRWCKTEKSVGDRLGSMSGTSALCHEVA